MAYTFNTERPPLYSLEEHDGDILAIPPAELERKFGPASWKVEWYLGKRFSIKWYGRNLYVAHRTLRWQPDSPVTSYVNNRKRTITKTYGYTKTVMDKFTANLKLEAGVKGKMFSASVKTDLGYEKQITQEWNEEYVEEFEETFEKGFTYVDWVLIEEITVTRKFYNGGRNKTSKPIEWLKKVLEQKTETISNKVVYRPEKFASEGYSSKTTSSNSSYIVTSFDDMNKVKSEQKSKVFSNLKEASNYLDLLESQNTHSEFLLLPHTKSASSTGEVKVKASSEWHGSQAEAEGECDDELQDKIDDEISDLEREGKEIISTETEGFDMDEKEEDGELFFKATGFAIIRWKEIG